MTDTPTANRFRVVDLKPDIASAVIELDDGRMATVPVKDGVDVKVGSFVGLDKDDRNAAGVPKDATIVRAL